MIKGALVFAAGMGVGYGIALSHNQDIKEATIAFKQFLQDEALKSDVERRAAADVEADAEGRPNTGGTVKDVREPEPIVEGEPEPIEAEVVEPGATSTEGESTP